MTSPGESRELDLVLLGATGFTGSLTAQYLADAAPPDLRWAIAGRDRARLAAVADRIGADVPLLTADVEDPGSLRRIAASTRAVATTVGPFLLHGEPVVAACAQTGTDYLDITGEPEFVDRMWLAHHETAHRTGARLVHACGFDSVPHDLGVLFTVQQMPEGVPLAVRGYVGARGALSGGTFASAVTAMSRTRQAGLAHRRRRGREGRPAGRRIRAIPGRPGYDRAAGRWVLPLPTLDPLVVVHSAAALDRYGPDFTYSHFAAFRSPLSAAAAAAVVAGTFAGAQVPPMRRALLGLRPPGSGPEEEDRERGWFRVRFVAEGGGRRVLTEVSGGDPGYGETARMLAESALCLLLDDLPETSGQVTTAVAMGDALRGRLQNGGMTFRTVDQGR